MNPLIIIGIGFGVIVFITAIAFGIMAATDTGPFDNPYCENNDNPCEHDGKCISNGNDEYKCECKSGWKGDDCREVDLVAVNNRPCEKDKPCKHGSKCNDIDSTGDGILDDYRCDCGLIEHADGEKWIGKDCNDLPTELKDSDKYDGDCDLDGEKRFGYIGCSNPDECMLYKNLEDGCEDNCAIGLDSFWCPDNDTCINDIDHTDSNGNHVSCPSIDAELKKTEHKKKQDCLDNEFTVWHEDTEHCTCAHGHEKKCNELDEYECKKETQHCCEYNDTEKKCHSKHHSSSPSPSPTPTYKKMSSHTANPSVINSAQTKILGDIDVCEKMCNVDVGCLGFQRYADDQENACYLYKSTDLSPDGPNQDPTHIWDLWQKQP